MPAAEKMVQPYGTWKSPVTPELVSQRIGFNDVQFDSDGQTLVWVEGRSGKGVLVARQDSQGRQDLTLGESVQAGVGYGGGDFCVSQGLVFFVEHNGQLYRRALGHSAPQAISPAFGSASSPKLSPDGRWLLYVWSDGREDCLAVVAADGQEWPLKVARGADFYMQPAWHPGGERIAWVEWDHPHMPWDGSRLMAGRVAGSPPRLTEQEQIAGGERIPVLQPEFSPDGRYLSFIETAGEWQNLVLLDLENGKRRILVEGNDFNLAQPAWVQGERYYGWSPDSQSIYFILYAGSFASLFRVDCASGTHRPVDTAPYTWIRQIAVSPAGEAAAFLASASNVPERVVRWDGQRLWVEAYSEPESVPTEMLPVARAISWKASDGTVVHGLFYAPSNPNFTSPGLPPAVLSVHGGPTSLSPNAYDPEIAYFTSRGFAWLEVNYRGSTGYGRSYQDMLLERWGDVDVEDTVGGARALADQGLADGGRLGVIGGSAGGYTVLNCLIRYPGVFKAGVCRYGVSNLFLLDLETHKFEAHYTASLVGELPEAAARYREWSPVFHADQIRDPLAVFQGAEDKVVPPNQAEAVVEVLRARGIPHIYKLYPGEGHGFRKRETIADYLEQAEKFLRQYLVFG